LCFKLQKPKTRGRTASAGDGLLVGD
jgi:hypothetical protein